MTNKNRKAVLKKKLSEVIGISLSDAAKKSGIDPDSMLVDKKLLSDKELKFWYGNNAKK